MKQKNKQKNTGEEPDRAKMNSSDRSGLDDGEEGWTQVFSKSSRKKLLLEFNKFECAFRYRKAVVT